MPALDTVAPNHWFDLVSTCSCRSLKWFPEWAKREREREREKRIKNLNSIKIKMGFLWRNGEISMSCRARRVCWMWVLHDTTANEFSCGWCDRCVHWVVFFVSLAMRKCLFFVCFSRLCARACECACLYCDDWRQVNWKWFIRNGVWNEWCPRIDMMNISKWWKFHENERQRCGKKKMWSRKELVRARFNACLCD